MPQPIKVLIVNDNANDAKTLMHELYRSGFDPSWLRVESEAHYLANLNFGFDLIISEYAGQQFSGLRALALLRQTKLEIPFIIVADAIDGDAAIATIRLGAASYLLKNQIAGLGPAVYRSMKRSNERTQHCRI
jgi:DNA-binding NtrC family response regulator